MAQHPGGLQVLVKGDLTQRYHDLDLREETQFFGQIRTTRLKLIRSRLVGGGRATHGGGNIAIVQFESILLMD